MGPDAVSDLFGLGLFSAAIKFLLGLDLKDEVEEPVKKGKQWTGSQVDNCKITKFQNYKII